MKVKVLIEDKFKVLATMSGDACEVEDFLSNESDDAAINAMTEMLVKLAQVGFQACPPKWFKPANKAEEIYECKRGDWRIMFFKGQGTDAAICVTAVRKSSQKADKQAVNSAASARKQYAAAKRLGQLEVVND